MKPLLRLAVAFLATFPFAATVRQSSCKVINMDRYYVKANVLFYAPARGGRPIVPVGDGYAPYLKAASSADALAVRVNGMPPEGNFDTQYGVALQLSYHPRIDYSKLKEGTNFVLLEGPKTVGEGVVTSAIYQQPSGGNPQGG